MSEPAPPRSLRAVVEYDGTGFSGWQSQGELRTVQRTLELALAAVLDEPVHLRAASRTDAGVHARGQVVVFRTQRTNIPLYGLERSVNNRLPKDVAVRSVVEVAPEWDPRSLSRGKHYRYTLWLDRLPTALDRRQTLWVRGPLDLEAMQRAAAAFLGTHDFEAFRSAGCPALHAVRTMYRVEVARGPRSYVYIDVLGNAFCQNQVRIMVGTLREIGLGRRSADDIPRILASRSRPEAGMTAPPEGLCLEEVIYDDRLPARPKTTLTAVEGLANA